MQHIHLIGIGGAGLSAIARILVEKGYQVSGSDKFTSPLTSDLEKIGVKIYIGHSAQNVAGADLVIRSSAIQDDNVEVRASKEENIPVLKRLDFLQEFLTPYHVIAVAGTHGKTTTTAMIAWMLHKLAVDPSYIIGGISKDLEGNAHAGSSKYFVIEADEYDRMFLGLHPTQIVITNIEHDHPDCFPTMVEYLGVFIEFARQIKPGGQLILCQDDYHTNELKNSIMSGETVLTYGTEKNAQYLVTDIQQKTKTAYCFKLIIKKELQQNPPVFKVNLNIPGRHNVINAAGALAVIDQLGFSIEEASSALSSFSGSGRRFDVLGTVNGIDIISDYAHHPTQVKTTLQAAKEAYPGSKIWAVWQPHTYSRTNLLFKEFCQAFTAADQVIVTDIYAAREPYQPFDYESLISGMNHPNASHVSDMMQISRILADHLQPGDVLVILSAGDAEKLGAIVLENLRNRFLGSKK